jgi:uncharacterized protein YegL
MTKKKKKEEKRAFISLLLDETGSMQAVKDETISGYNAYVDNLAEEAPQARFTMTRFNSLKTEIAHDAVPITEVPHLTGETYQPAASTPLYDAIGRTIRAVEVQANRKKDRVLVAILTDGFENASSEYSLDAVKSLIKEKTDKGWEFAFIGADISAVREARQWGIPDSSAVLYQMGTEDRVMARLSKSSAAYARGDRFSLDDDEAIRRADRDPQPPGA